jgi:hypothetical protein
MAAPAPVAIVDLTTLANVKSFMTITNTDDDALLQRLLTQVSGAVANYLNRNLLVQSYTERYDGNDAHRLCLRQSPITDVASLLINGSSIPESTDGGIVLPGYAFDGFYIYLNGYQFYRGVQNVIVTYTAGFPSIPFDVEEAVIEMVSDRYKMKSRIGEKSKALQGGGSVSYDTDYMSDKVKGSLSNYRRMIPI